MRVGADGDLFVGGRGKNVEVAEHLLHVRGGDVGEFALVPAPLGSIFGRPQSGVVGGEVGPTRVAGGFGGFGSVVVHELVEPLQCGMAAATLVAAIGFPERVAAGDFSHDR